MANMLNECILAILFSAKPPLVIIELFYRRVMGLRMDKCYLKDDRCYVQKALDFDFLSYALNLCSPLLGEPEVNISP